MPGIGVYQGRIDDPQQNQLLLSTLPDGENPHNLEFLTRVRHLINLLNQTPTGHRMLDDIGRALPLPSPGTSAWGNEFSNPDGTPSRIRVVIGMAPGSNGFEAISLDATRAANSLGSDSVVSIDPRFPLAWVWHDTTPILDTPVTLLAHEFVHVWRNLMGADDPARVVEIHRYNPDNPVDATTESHARDEFLTVGNAAAQVLNPDTRRAALLGADTQLTRSREIVNDLLFEYRVAGDEASAQLLEATRMARTPASGSAPTESAIARERNETVRTHYQTGTLPAERWVVRGNTTEEWQQNLGLITPQVQQQPGNATQVLERVQAPVPAPVLPPCGPTQRSYACVGPVYDVQPWITLQVQSASDKCMRADRQIQPELYSCNGDQTNQRWTYHPRTKMLSIGDTLTELGKAPTSPALCLTADRIGGSRLAMLPCELSNAKQRWEYTTTGLLRAVDAAGAAYGCVNAQGNYTSDGTAMVLWYCDGANNGTWNLHRGHESLTAFEIVASTGAPIEAAGDTVISGWEEKSNSNTVWTQSKKQSTSTNTGYYALRNLGSGRCLVANNGAKLRDCAESDVNTDARWSLYQHPNGMFTLQTDVAPNYLPSCAQVNSYGHLEVRGCIYFEPWYNNKYWSYQWRIAPTWAVVDRA